MDFRILASILVLASFFNISATQKEAEFLENTINQLRNTINSVHQKQKTTTKRPTTTTTATTTTQNPIRRVYQEQNQVPSLHLTKAELAAFYENALNRGKTVKLDPGDGSATKINAVVHELDGAESQEHADVDSGYYYYYYPLKSFMDELIGLSYDDKHHEGIKLDDHHPSYHDHPDHDHKYYPHHNHKEVTKPYIHSHTHQHNVHIETTKNEMGSDMKKKHALEPLFMAISGFIGMTVMFILSILVLPRFDKLKPKRFKQEEEGTSISRIALQAIEGQDCNERFTCEVAKVANAFNLYNNRFVKFVRRVAPYFISVRIGKIGKYTDKKYKCAAIHCKRKGPNPFNNNNSQNKTKFLKTNATTKNTKAPKI